MLKNKMAERIRYVTKDRNISKNDLDDIKQSLLVKIVDHGGYLVDSIYLQVLEQNHYMTLLREGE